MRKSLAGKLIRLAHRINPPKATEATLSDALLDLSTASQRQLIKEAMTHPDPKAAGRAVAELNQRRRDAMSPERRESRGWNN